MGQQHYFEVYVDCIIQFKRIEVLNAPLVLLKLRGVVGTLKSKADVSGQLPEWGRILVTTENEQVHSIECE